MVKIKPLKFEFAAYASFPWKLNRYSYGVQFGINCTALDQSKLSNFVECTISDKIIQTYCKMNKTTTNLKACHQEVSVSLESKHKCKRSGE